MTSVIIAVSRFSFKRPFPESSDLLGYLLASTSLKTHVLGELGMLDRSVKHGALQSSMNYNSDTPSRDEWHRLGSVSCETILTLSKGLSSFLRTSRHRDTASYAVLMLHRCFDSYSCDSFAFGRLDHQSPSGRF